MQKFIFVYVDSDHNDIELFSSLAKAKKHAIKEWGTEEETGCEFEQEDDMWHYCDYVNIYKRTIG